MIWLYFDASALIKRYSSEKGTKFVNHIFEQLPPEQLGCSAIGVLEIVANLVRKRNDGRLTLALFTQAISQVKDEIVANEAVTVISVDDDLLYSAMNLIAKHNMNATDAIILRSALELQKVLDEQANHMLLCCCDKRLLRAAQKEGIATLDPETDALEAIAQRIANS